VFADADASGDAVILSDESYLPYDRPPLSKGFMTGDKSAEDILIHDADWYAEKGIEVVTDASVTRLDKGRMTAETEAGEVYRFEKALIATGSRIRKLGCPGADQADIQYLRRILDSESIRSKADGAEKTLVIGGGFIGVEVAASLTMRGNSVTLTYPEERMLSRIFTKEMDEFFVRYYREKGVEIVSGRKIEAITADRGRTAARVEGDQMLPADFIAAGIGVAPNVELLDLAGAEENNGVIVDRHMETSIPGIFAAGDITRYPDESVGKRRRVEHWQNAVDQGTVAAKNMLGEAAEFTDGPYFFSDEFDLSWELWGDPQEADGAYVLGKVDDGAFSTWWVKDDRVVCAFVMSRPDEEREDAKKAVQQNQALPDGVRKDASRATL
jgi:NADPH-dependent 2,4-dienoyl-CoA reductase/sulfur reductase-like enzyme